MASIKILDGDGSAQYILVSSGAGTSGDPYIMQQAVTLLAGTAAFGKLAANSGVDIGDVDVLTLCGQSIAFGTGVMGATVVRTTLATDDPAVALLGTIDADTSSLAGCVGGTEVQVDVVGSLPAGTNAIGKLAANDGVDIGDVDVTSVVPGTGATNLGKAIDSPTGATDTGVLMLATRDDSLASLTPIEGDNVALRTDSTGALWVNVVNTTVPVDTQQYVEGTGAASMTGTLALMEVAGNVTAPLQGSAADGLLVNLGTNNDVTVTGDALTALQLIDNCISGSEAQVDVVAALPAGTNTIGNVGVVTQTTGGASMHKTISAASTNATSVKGSAGTVYGIQASNANASARYLKLYNKASAPTVGTDTPVMVLVLPPSNGGTNVPIPAQGLAFGTGIAFALTTGIADSDTGAVSANEHAVNIQYA